LGFLTPEELGLQQQQREPDMNKSTQKVIDTLQNHMAEGILIWHNPCMMATQANLVSGNEYQGINHLMTAVVSMSEGYKSAYWATFKQIGAAGGTLENAKGKGVPIIFYKDLPEEKGEEGKKRFVLRHSFVFNLDLVTGLDLDAVETQSSGEMQTDQNAEQVINDYLKRECIPVTVGNPAYVPSVDTIKLPARESFVSMDEMYSTMLHEVGHSTGHKSRLARFTDAQTKLEQKEDYSKEELVAEIFSALMCHGCGVDSESSIKNSAAYLQGWSRFIKDEAEAFVWAVNQAYKARSFILGGEGPCVSLTCPPTAEQP
jgi:antirestriction protein ArdC